MVISGMGDFPHGMVYNLVTTGSPRRSGRRTEVVQGSERSWLQHTESSVAAYTAARESRSAGNKTEQAREEGDVPDREQQRDSCPSRATSVGFGQGVGHLPVSVTWVGPCRRWEDVDGGIEVVLDEEGQRWASWGRVRDGTWTGSDHNEGYRRWYSDWGIQGVQGLLILEVLETGTWKEWSGCKS